MKLKNIFTSHKTMKYRYILCTLIALGTCFYSFANGRTHKNYQDTIPLSDPAYAGHRLAVTDIKIVEKENWTSILFTAINTGREDITFGENTPKPHIVFEIEQLSKEYLGSFTKTLWESDLKIKAGEILFDREIKFKRDSQIPAPVEKEVLSAEIAVTNLNDNSKTALTSNEPAEPIDDDSNCSDLVIESITILKKSKNTVTLKYRVKNQGKKPASIIGNSKNNEDNLAMSIHMSSSDKLTRGSILLDRTFLKGGSQLPDGKLYPGKSVTEEIKIDITKMTRFTPMLILEIDPFLTVQECSETNNLNHIKVKQE